MAGVLTSTMAKKPVRLNLVPIEVRSQQEQADVAIPLWTTTQDPLDVMPR